MCTKLLRNSVPNKSDILFKICDEKFHGELTQDLLKRFYKSGKIESEETFDKKLVRNGESKSYYKNGRLKRKWNFKNGVRDGLQQNYYGDGTLSDETETTEGIQNGYMRIYSRDGKLEKEVYYKNGIQVSI